jgi:hypothetical protein
MRIIAACLVLTACSAPSTVELPGRTDESAVTALPSPAPSCQPVPTPPATPSADSLAQACPPSAEGHFPTPDPCTPYDAEVGDYGTCCGGDLRTQRCGVGLICAKTGGTIGMCRPDPIDPAFSSVCVWVDNPNPPKGSCGLMVARGDDKNCVVLSACPNHEQVLSCDHGACSCSNYNSLNAQFDVGDTCSSTYEHALAVAQEKCAFPACYGDVMQGIEGRDWK